MAKFIVLGLLKINVGHRYVLPYTGSDRGGLLPRKSQWAAQKMFRQLFYKIIINLKRFI